MAAWSGVVAVQMGRVNKFEGREKIIGSKSEREGSVKAEVLDL